MVIIFVGVLTLIMVGRTSLFVTSYYSPLYSTASYPLGGKAAITQEFQARYPGLNRLALFVRKSGDDSDARLLLHLKDRCDAAVDLVTATADLADLPDAGLYAFSFPTIDDSLGRKFCATINTQALDAPAEVRIYASNADVYWSGKATYHPDDSPHQPTENENSRAKYMVWLPLVQKSGNDKNFDVGFRLYYDGRTELTLIALLGYLATDKPFVFGIPGFYVFLGIIYVAGLIVFLRLVFNLKFGPKL